MSDLGNFGLFRSSTTVQSVFKQNIMIFYEFSYRNMRKTAKRQCGTFAQNLL